MSLIVLCKDNIVKTYKDKETVKVIFYMQKYIFFIGFKFIKVKKQQHNVFKEQ